MLAGAAVIVRHQHLERVQPGEILRCPASAQAEGQAAVDQAVDFALNLRRLVFEARRSAGLPGGL